MAFGLRNTSREYSSQSDDKLVSDETTHLLSVIFLYIISPAISFLGVIGNIFSIIVLIKHGLHKCSNILLFSLAVSDIGYLLAYNSVPNILYAVEGEDKFLYSYTTSYVLFVFYFVIVTIDYGMALTSLSMPMLITFERLVTVFLPLKCRQIITPRRTWLAVMTSLVIHTSCVIYNCFWFRFEYSFDPALNKSVGLIEKSDLYYKDLQGNEIYEEIMYSMKIYPTITFIGCVTIIIKVNKISRKRELMTSKASSTSKTTKTLLVVCFGYLLTCIITGLPSYLPKKFSGYSITSDNPTNTGKVTYIVTSVWLQINGSWNFFVYVALNKNFRDTFKELFKVRCCRRNGPSR